MFETGREINVAQRITTVIKLALSAKINYYA